jgi:hypothetical protein
MSFLRRAIIVILILTPFTVFGQEEVAKEESVLEEPEQIEPAAEPATELNIDDLRRRITGEARQELMNVSLGSSAVSLFATGSWMGDLQGNLGFSYSPLGLDFASPDSPILYKQEVDLTLSLWINNRWFVEVSFVDDSAQNTYRAGFQGRKEEFLQYAGIGNTGLDFPSFPYLDLGGDSPSSFGFYSRFGTSDFGIHTLVRYDAASREERTFTGGRERTYSDLQPQNTLRGISFVLPDTDINPEITVYIEDDKGTLRDTKGRRWRYAMQSEYAFSRAYGILELSIRPAGMVAVAYAKGGDPNPWNTSMGTYDGVVPGFLMEVQNWFGPSVDLAKWSGGSGLPGEVFFGSTPALVVYQPGAFSPFEKRNRYDAVSSSAEKAALVRLSTGSEISGFELIRLENTAVNNETFFSGIVSQMGVYELVSTNRYDLRSPAVCFPLAVEYPEIYQSFGVFSGDIVIRFTNYSGANGYFIGTDVIPGSVQVWRSGIQYTGFNYNSSSGEVAINGSVGQNEVIRITYLKRSEGTRLGSVATGIGAIYRKGQSPFSVQAAVGARWNLTEESFTEEENSNAGNVGISAKTSWEYDNLKARITGGFAFVQTDTTGLYRAAGMEGNETVVYLPSETSFISNPPSSYSLSNRADLIYRNYNNNIILGNNLMYIDSSADVVTGINRPYPVKDRQLGDTQVLTAEFDLETGNWTGFQVPLYNDSDLLSRAREIEIPFRFYGFNQNPTNNFKIIVQIGSLSGKDSAYTENPDFIWEKYLFTNDWTLIPDDPPYTNTSFDYNARIARFRLNDEERLMLGDAKYLRIIVVNDGTSEISGRFLLAPPIVRGTAFRAITFNGSAVTSGGDFSAAHNRVRASEAIDTGVSLVSAFGDIIRRLHSNSSNQRVLKIDWNDMEHGISAGVDGRISELPLADYRELSFFVKIQNQFTNNETMKFVVAEGPNSFSDYKLNVEIPLSEFNENKWSKVTIRYQGNNTGIMVDGEKAHNASVSYKPKKALPDNQGARTSYIAVLVNPASDDITALLDDSTIYIDEIILEDSILYYRMNAGTAVEFTKKGTFVSAGDIPLLSDFSISNAFESEGRAQSETEEQDFSGSLVNRTGVEISVLGVKLSGNFAFTTAEDTFVWNADHSLSRKIGPFSVKETFYASPSDNSARHNFNMEFLSDFYAKFSADALYDYSRLFQKWNVGLGYSNKKEYIPSVVINTQAIWTRNNNTAEMDDYGKFWLETWETLVPDNGQDADARKTQAQIILSEKTKPVGAVITVEGSTNSIGANNITRLENSVFLDIPLTFSKTSINLRLGRGFKRHLYYFGEDITDDSNKFFESIEDFSPVWGVFPIYSLFAPELETAMYDGLNDSLSAESAFYSSFSDHYSTRINLPAIYNPSAFFIPNKITFQIERTLEQKMDTRTDKLNIGGSLGFSAINMFGNMGYRPIFKFYQTDEYSHSIDAYIYLPRDEDISFRIKSVLNAGFKGADGGTLNFVNTYILRSDSYWFESFVLGWEAPIKKSLLGKFYNKTVSGIEKQKSWIGLSSLLKTNYEQLRKESLELVFDRQTDYLRWSIIAGHEEIIRIQGKLNFSTYIKIRGGEDKNTETLIFDLILGTALRVIF